MKSVGTNCYCVADDMLGGHVDDMEADMSKPIVSIRFALHNDPRAGPLYLLSLYDQYKLISPS